MAISDNSLNQAQTLAKGQEQTQQQQTQQQQTQQQYRGEGNDAPRLFSWSALGQSAGYSISRKPISETLSKITKALNEVIKGHEESDYKVKLIPMDIKDYPNLAVSLLVVSLIDTSISVKTVASHILVIADSVDEFPSKTENYLGKSYTVHTPTSQIVTTNAIEIVQEELNRQFPGYNQLYADFEVVPRSFNTENHELVYSLAANSLLAVESTLFRLQERAELNIAHASNDSSLSVKVNWIDSEKQLEDSVGLPLRSDIELGIMAQPTNVPQNNMSSMLAQRSIQIGYVTGYMDTIWDPAINTSGYNPYQMNTPQYGYGHVTEDGSAITSKIRAMFVITEARMRDVSSLTSQLFSLLPALLLRNNNLWMDAFKPRAFSGPIDYKNVGALNIEVNLPLAGQGPNPSGRGAPIDINSANFSNEAFYDFMNATFRKNIGIAIDVEEAGSSTWTTSIFVAMAQGVQGARDEVFNAVNYLTNGNFQNYFSKDMPMVEYYTTIQNGWYESRDGFRRDIRDLDLISLLNNESFADNQAVLDAYINSYTDKSVPLKYSLAERYRIIEGALGHFELTGYSSRIMFTEKFLNAFLCAAGDAGLIMRPQTQSMSTASGRIAAGFNANMFGTNPNDVNHNVFAAANMQGQQYNNWGAQYTSVGRHQAWGR